MSLIFPKDVLKIIAGKVIHDQQAEIDALRHLLSCPTRVILCDYPGCKNIYYNNVTKDHYENDMKQWLAKLKSYKYFKYSFLCWCGRHNVCEDHYKTHTSNVSNFWQFACCEVCVHERSPN